MYTRCTRSCRRLREHVKTLLLGLNYKILPRARKHTFGPAATILTPTSKTSDPMMINSMIQNRNRSGAGSTSVCTECIGENTMER